MNDDLLEVDLLAEVVVVDGEGGGGCFFGDGGVLAAGAGDLLNPIATLTFPATMFVAFCV